MTTFFSPRLYPSPLPIMFLFFYTIFLTLLGFYLFLSRSSQLLFSVIPVDRPSLPSLPLISLSPPCNSKLACHTFAFCRPQFTFVLSLSTPPASFLPSSFPNIVTRGGGSGLKMLLRTFVRSSLPVLGLEVGSTWLVPCSVYCFLVEFPPCRGTLLIGAAHPCARYRAFLFLSYLNNPVVV